MNKSIELLDAYKAALRLESDNAAARRLNVSRQAISKWRNGENHPDAESIEKMALATDKLPGPWLAAIEADRARNPENRKVWLRLAQALSAAAAIAALAALPALSHAAAHSGWLPIV